MIVHFHEGEQRNAIHRIAERPALDYNAKSVNYNHDRSDQTKKDLVHCNIR